MRQDFKLLGDDLRGDIASLRRDMHDAADIVGLQRHILSILAALMFALLGLLAGAQF